MIIFLKENEQHRHKNGGGWVANTANVADSAFISDDAQVYGNARVYGNAQVYGNARVYGNAWVYNPLTITGSAHSVSLVSYTHIAIGCEVHTFSDWLKNYKSIGKKNRYTPEQIKEYGEILKYLVKAAKVYVKRNQKALSCKTK